MGIVDKPQTSARIPRAGEFEKPRDLCVGLFAKGEQIIFMYCIWIFYLTFPSPGECVKIKSMSRHIKNKLLHFDVKLSIELPVFSAN